MPSSSKIFTNGIRLAAGVARTLTAGLLLGGLSSNAIAASPDDGDTQTMMVSTQGLDLSQKHAQETLARRIELAARRVCGYDERQDLQGLNSYQDCHDAAAGAARLQLRVLVAQAEMGRDGIRVADSGR